MKKITSKVQEFSYDKDRILRVRLVEGAEINLADAEEGFEMAHQLTKGEKHFVLIDLRTNNPFTLAAKNFIETKKEYRNRIAEAFIVSSNVNRIARNFYFSINRPSIPTRLFLTEQDAINWFDSLIYLSEMENE